jgi:hypothetical protein
MFAILLLLSSLLVGTSHTIAHVNIVDVKRGRILEDRSVYIDNGRISRITKKAPRQSATVIDGRGKFLIPGLWDTYTYALDGTAKGLPVLDLLVAYGVTDVRVVASEMPVADQVATRERILYGQQVGPRLWIGGKALISPCPDAGRRNQVVTDAASTSDAVDALAKEHVDFIFIAPRLRPELHLVVAQRAHERHLLATGWIVTGFKEASEQGFDIIDHPVDLQRSTSALRSEYTNFYFGDLSASLPPPAEAYELFARLTDSPDQEYYTSTIHTLVKHHTAVSTNEPSWGRRRELGDAEHLRFKTAKQIAELEAEQQRRDTEEADRAARGHRKFVPREHLGAMYRSGIHLLSGSDTSDLYRETPGLSLHDALTTFVGDEVGMTPLDALRAATLWPAESMKQDALGSVEAGKLADLVMLSANPLVDIHNLRRIDGVFVAGRYFDRGALDRLLHDVESYVRRQP